MRTASPAKTHKPKDFCTIEQAEYIANLIAARHIELWKYHRWHRRLWRKVVKAFKGVR